MRLRFMCPHHRSLIEADPSRARSSWELSFTKALELRQRGATEQSIAAAGCALEAAEALLVLHGCRQAQDLRRFTESAVLLRQLLPLLRQPGLVRGLLAGCHARLEALLTAGADTGLVLECCQRLSRADAEDTALVVADIPAPTVHWMVCSATGETAAAEPDLVQLEVPREVLQRLLRDHRLAACELRCLNRHSRDLVRQAVKDCLRTTVLAPGSGYPAAAPAAAHASPGLLRE